jgi:hypothetical protein
MDIPSFFSVQQISQGSKKRYFHWSSARLRK